jgi:hypothetical protein
MAALETVLATAGGALSATVGVVAGAVLPVGAQDRHWLRNKQLASYQELMCCPTGKPRPWPHAWPSTQC